MRSRRTFEMIGERESVAVTITGDDLWRGVATTIPIPDQTNGVQMTLVSTSASDASGGTGVRTVFIHYLDTNWVEQTETVTLTGVTGANTVATDIKFVQEIHAASVGANGVAVGDITMHLTGTPATVFDIIAIGGNMSLTMMKMIPAGFNMYINGWTASATGNKPQFIRLRSTDHHGVLYNGGSPVFIFKDVTNLEESPYVKDWTREDRICIPAKSVIKVTSWATQALGNASSSLIGELISVS